jgi:hypothetical protein
MGRIRAGLAVTAVSVAIAACSGGSPQSAGDHPSATTTRVTTTTTPGTATTALPSSIPPTTTAAFGTGFFNERQVEAYVGQVSSSYQEAPLQFSDSKSVGGDVATTTDGICTFILTNTLDEPASLVDAIAVSCGSPSKATVLTQSESTEEAAYLDGIVKQFAGPAALNWVNQQAESGAEHGSAAAAHRSFGPVTVGIEFGAGVLFEKLETTG